MNTNTFPNQTSKYVWNTHYVQSTVFLPNSAEQAIAASEGSTMACQSNSTHSLILYSLGAENGFYL